MKPDRMLLGFLQVVVLFTLTGCLAPRFPRPASTADWLQRERITLPVAAGRHAKADAPNPALIFVDITASGTVCIAGTSFSDETYSRILGKAVADCGATVPLCFRADQSVQFNAVWKRVVVARKHRLFRFSFATREGDMMEFFVSDAPSSEMVNTLGVDGDRWTFNGKEVTQGQLAATAHDWEKVSTEAEVRVRVNSGTTHGQVIKAMDVVWAAGFHTLVFADEKMN
jgi:biopolymer transport protein ExbD